jgi:ferredoxin
MLTNLDIAEIFDDVAPTIIFSCLRINARLLSPAPPEARDCLAPYVGWSLIIYALPITDEALWVWYRFDDRRYLFANHILERAANAVSSHLEHKRITCLDVALSFPGKVSLVELAVCAGLGTRGLNNLLLHERFGSWIQLHALLVDCEVTESSRHPFDICTKCGNCIKACPAEAIRGKRFLPARCSTLVASPWMPKSKARAVTSNAYIECAECITSCPIGRQPEGLFSWKRSP